MESTGSILNVLFYLASAAIIVPLFRRLGLGAILGYLCAGVLIGPQVFSLIDDPESVLHFSEIGVVMLLFLIGLELNPKTLWQMKSDIALLGGGQILITVAVIIALGMLVFGLDLSPAIVVAMALALSSTAFAIQLMNERGVMATPSGRHGFAILLMQDLAVIPILFVVTALSATTVESTPLDWVLSIGAVAALVLFGRFGLNPLLSLVAAYGSRDSMTATALLIVTGSAYLMYAVNLSMGLGAIIAGIMLANSSFRHQLETDIEPFKGLTLGLFFVAIGMMLDLNLLYAQPLLIIGLTLGLCLIKTLIIASLVKWRGICWRDDLQLGVMLSQGGEFGFVILAQALSQQVISTELSSMITLVIGFSMALTPLLLIGFDQLVKPRKRDADSSMDIVPDQEPEVLILGFGRFGQITGRILSANNILFTALDKDPEHIEFVRKFGNTVYFGDACRMDLLEMAGIDHARTVLVAIDDPQAASTVVKLVRHEYPEVQVIARAHNRTDYLGLKAAGAHVVIREVYDGSIIAANETLVSLGYTTTQAIRKVSLFRQHDEQLLERASSYTEDLDKLIELGIQGRTELEDLFDQDQNS